MKSPDVSPTFRRREILAPLAALAVASPPALTVAAASNLASVAPRLAGSFRSLTGIVPTFSFASTAQLARQITDGAPFDVFAAADTAHTDELARRNLLTQTAVYATGILALWFPAGKRRRIEDLADPAVRTIAVARPELAPYGAAAVQTLRNLNLWLRLQPRVVYAGSVAMAKQYGATGNADAVFLPLALALRERGSTIPIEERLHSPLHQALGIVKTSKRPGDAQRFADFLTNGPGHALLLANGYR